MQRLALPHHESGGHWVKVLSYNIQVGIPSNRYRHYLTNSWKHVLPFHGRKANLQNIGRFLSDFDIVGLQEVDAGSLRTIYMNQTSFLAREAGFPHWHQTTNRDLSHIAKHSMGLLSRFPSAHSVGHRLPSRIPGRGALEVHMGRGKQPLVVLTLHLSLGRNDRMRQLEYISDVARRYEHVIVMGDLNCAHDSDEIAMLINEAGLCEPLHTEQTYPSWQPLQSFDHILVSPSLEVRDVQVYRRFYSDQLPVCAQIKVPDEVHLL